MALPDITALKAFLGVDYVDSLITKNLNLCLDTAVATLHGAVGEDVETVLPDDDRVNYLVLTYADDLYSERGMGGKVSNQTRRLVHDLELQLKLELARKREETA